MGTGDEMNLRILFVLIMCLITASCNPGFQDGPATQNGKVFEPTRTLTTVGGEVLTAPLESTPTASIIHPDEPSMLPREEFTLDLDYLLDLNELPSGEHLVLWDEEERRLDLVTWEGTRIPLFTVNDSQSKIDEGLGAWPLSLPTKGIIIPIGYLATDDDRFINYSKLYYFIDLESGEVQGLVTQCETAGGSNLASLGLGNFAFRCLDDLDRWYFLSLNEPFELTSSVIPFGKYAFDYVPRWETPDLIEYYNRRGSDIFPHFYLDIEAGDKWSEEYPLWVGITSPDGKWVEVREGHAQVPDKVGLLQIKCLKPKIEECAPAVILDFGRKEEQILEPAAWSPDSRYMVYIGSAGLSDVPTNIWIYDVASEEIVHEWEFPGFYQYRFIREAPAIWAPDGRLLVEWMNAHEDPSMAGYLLNIEDGSLTKLYEGGQLLGTVQIP